MATGLHPLPPIIGFKNQTLIKFEQKMHFIVFPGARTASTGPRLYRFVRVGGVSEVRSGPNGTHGRVYEYTVSATPVSVFHVVLLSPLSSSAGLKVEAWRKASTSGNNELPRHPVPPSVSRSVLKSL